MSKNTGSQPIDINGLFKNANADGVLGKQALQSLNVVNVGNHIQSSLGVRVDDFQSSEVVLVSMMPDDSGSIRFGGNAEAIRSGHNLVLDALKSSKQKDQILAHTRYLNGHVLFPYSPIDRAVAMNKTNYNPSLGTPLYDQTLILLGTVVAKSQEFIDNGVAVRTVTLLLTDGSDQHSERAVAHDVRALVNDMQSTENHIIAALGVHDRGTDFRKIFKEMGIADEWILTVKNNASDIRRAFQVFSQSAINVAAGVHKAPNTSMGGFFVN